MKAVILFGGMLFYTFACQPNKQQTFKQDSLTTTPKITQKKKNDLPPIPDSLQWKSLPTEQSMMMSKDYLYYDINQDGYKDSVIHTTMRGNSGNGGSEHVAKNGKTQAIIRYEINEGLDYAGPGFVKCVLPYSKAYDSPENKPFLRVLKEITAQKPDPSLQWIVESTLSNQYLQGNLYFQQIFRFKSQFLEGEFSFPTNYRIEADTDSLTKVCILTLQKNKIPTNPTTTLYDLAYRCENIYRFNEQINMGSHSTEPYKKLKQADKSAIYTIYTLPHAVIAEKDKKYAWIFVSDYDLTEAPERMRWNSIKSAKLFGSYVIISHFINNLKTNNFIVNIETGLCVKLNPNTSKDYDLIFKEMEKITKK